ncbi:MAG: YdcH family protein [Rickettsiales bacterium]
MQYGFDRDTVLRQIKKLEEEHRVLDEKIDALTKGYRVNMLEVQRMKRKKLQIKDAIAYLRSISEDDIIA